MNPCKIPVPCDQLKPSELRSIALACLEKNREQCLKKGDKKKSECNVKPITPRMNTKSLCTWLKYNPEISTTQDITRPKLLERAKRAEKADPDFYNRFFGNYACEYRGDYLDVRDLVYFLDVYASDPIHKIYFPKCDKSSYKNSDFYVQWNAKKEDGKGTLIFPSGFADVLRKFEKETSRSRGNPWLAIPMSLIADYVEEIHINGLIYYPHSGTVERIEPAGYKYGYYDQKTLDDRLQKYFSKMGIKFIRTIDQLPRQGFAHVEDLEVMALTLDQSGDPEGFCQTWIYFYFDQKFRHPDWTTPQLFEYITNTIWESPYTYLEVIRQYHGIVQTYTDKLLRKFGYRRGDLDQWFMKNYPKIAKKYGLC